MDHVWRLRYGAEELIFGDVALGVFHTTLPEVGTMDADYDDRPMPRADGVFPGEDFMRGQVVSFTLGLAAPGDRAATEALRDRVASVWRADGLRLTPGALAELIAPSGRRAYGRPREFTAIDSMVDAGGVEAVANFRTMRAAWYGAERSVEVGFVSVPTSGFTFPITFPLVMQGEQSGAEALEIAGDLRSPVTVQVYGPIVNADVQVGDLRIILAGSIAADDVVTVDPVNRTVLSAQRGSVAGMLAPRSTRISALLLEPGQYTVALRGTSESGNARVVVRSRDAFASY